MPLSKMTRCVLAGSLAAIVASIGATAWSQRIGGTMPRQIRMGATDMVIQRVEPEIVAEEVREAVQAQLDRELMCFRWPSIWLADNERRRVYTVRYDLMERDWGADVADDARNRMQEFVGMGLLTVRDVSDAFGPGTLEYRLTREGGEYLQGSPSAGRLSFCASSGRRVVDIVETEFGTFACGTLNVRFTHTSEAWPDWARTPASQARVAEQWGAPGVVGEGRVAMSRQWFAETPRDGRANGQLRSLCYDESERIVRGEDMELFATHSNVSEPVELAPIEERAFDELRTDTNTQ